MAEQELGTIVARLDSVDQTLKSLIQRIYALEHHAVRTYPSPEIQKTPPPMVPLTAPRAAQEPPRNPEIPKWVTATRPIPPRPTPTPPRTAKQVDDLEYKIGLTGLLRGGAVVIVIAIVYLVALAVSRGYITPAVQFVGEIILCASFIALGFIKRNEREEFGQLMVGIGSCGLYLTFAGGHLFKHLYTGETLVALFVALSFANLAFSWWRSSRSFLAIGMLGGLTAAMLPMHQFKPVLDVELHFMILIPIALIVIKNRWQEMAAAMWIAATAALMPALSYDSVWMVRIGALYGTGLISAITYGKVWSKTDFDPWCGLSCLMLVVAGIGALVADNVHHGSLHVLALAAAAAIAGYIFRANENVRNALWVGSLATAVCLAPIGFHRLEAGSAYAILSVLLALASLRVAPKALTALAGLQLALGLCAYTAPWATSPVHFSLGAETWLLSALMASAVACAYACYKAGGASEPMMLVGALAVFPLFSRFGFILLTSAGIGFIPALGLLIPFAVFTVLLLSVGKSSKWLSSLLFGWITLTLSLVAYAQLLVDGFQNPGFDTTVVFSLMGLAVFASVASREAAGKRNFDYLVGISGAIVGLLVIRLSGLWLTIPSIHLGRTLSITVGLLAVTALSGSLAIRFQWRGLVPQGWLALVVASIATISVEGIGSVSIGFINGLLIACIGGVFLMANCSSRFTNERASMTGGCVVGIWVLFSALAFNVFTRSPIGMKEAPALTLAWIIYAISLIALGFHYRARYLRYWSFGVFGLTLIKIFLSDLSSLDPGVRVLLIFLLGCGMVGGGYWYIRMRPNSNEEESLRESLPAVP